MTTLAIGFNGAMGAGKDTAADALAALADAAGIDSVVRLSFARRLRETIEVLTRGAIVARYTCTSEEKARAIPDGSLGATLGDALDRIHVAIAHALSDPDQEKEEAHNRSEKENEAPMTQANLLEAVRRLTGVDWAARDGFAWRPDWLDRKIDTPQMTVGRLLQLFGTEVARQLCRDDIWIRPVERQMERAALAIVSDVRFPNEFAFMRNRGGLVFSVDASIRRPIVTTTTAADAKTTSNPSKAQTSETPVPAAFTSVAHPDTRPAATAANAAMISGSETVTKDGRSTNHASETALRDVQFTAVLDNNGSLEQFLDTVRARVWPSVVAAFPSARR